MGPYIKFFHGEKRALCGLGIITSVPKFHIDCPIFLFWLCKWTVSLLRIVTIRSISLNIWSIFKRKWIQVKNIQQYETHHILASSTHEHCPWFVQAHYSWRAGIKHFKDKSILSFNHVAQIYLDFFVFKVKICWACQIVFSSMISLVKFEPWISSIDFQEGQSINNTSNSSFILPSSNLWWWWRTNNTRKSWCIISCQIAIIQQIERKKGWCIIAISVFLSISV